MGIIYFEFLRMVFAGSWAGHEVFVPSLTLQLTLYCFMVFLLCSSASPVQHYDQMNQAHTITVDYLGSGDFSKVQQAIDSIPLNNDYWILVHIKAGIYNEKINIPRGKPFIVLEGESAATTVIQWGDAGDSTKSTTFSLFADNFVARHITFKNSYNEQPVTWAPAALINGDKASFYDCSFISLEDTLTDSEGRHMFQSCYIEGGRDFIWGNGQSIYQGCTLNVTAAALGYGPGYITANARYSLTDNSGFVFKECTVVGTGEAYLGRAYRKYSRVIFYKSNIDSVIVPKGWSAWDYVGHENTITFAEVDCNGNGADMSGRVKWMKKLSGEDLNQLLNAANFIDEEGWIERQPNAASFINAAPMVNTRQGAIGSMWFSAAQNCHAPNRVISFVILFFYFHTLGTFFK